MIVPIYLAIDISTFLCFKSSGNALNDFAQERFAFIVNVSGLYFLIRVLRFIIVGGELFA